MTITNADFLRIGVTHNRALCCQCGNLRIVSDNYYPPKLVFEGASRAEIENWKSVRHGDRYAHVEPWHRLLGELKCHPCGTRTTHALLRDCDAPEFRDYCESQMESVGLNAARAERSLLEQEIAKLRNLGIAVDLRHHTFSDGDVFAAGMEQTLFDKSWRIELNPNLPALIQIRMLKWIWAVISDPKASEKFEWDFNHAARYIELMMIGVDLEWYANHVMDSGGLEDQVQLWSEAHRFSDAP